MLDRRRLPRGAMPVSVTVRLTRPTGRSTDTRGRFGQPGTGRTTRAPRSQPCQSMQAGSPETRLPCVRGRPLPRQRSETARPPYAAASSTPGAVRQPRTPAMYNRVRASPRLAMPVRTGAGWDGVRVRFRSRVLFPGGLGDPSGPGSRTGTEPRTGRVSALAGFDPYRGRGGGSRLRPAPRGLTHGVVVPDLPRAPRVLRGVRRRRPPAASDARSAAPGDARPCGCLGAPARRRLRVAVPHALPPGAVARRAGVRGGAHVVLARTATWRATDASGQQVDVIAPIRASARCSAPTGATPGPTVAFRKSPGLILNP